MVHPVAVKLALVTLPPIFIGCQWLKSHKPHSIFYKKQKPTKLSTGIKMDVLHAPVPLPLETDPLPLNEEEAKNNQQALAHPIFLVESLGIAPDEGIHSNNDNNNNNNDSYNSKDEHMDEEDAEVEHEEDEEHEDMPENAEDPSECSTAADAMMQWVLSDAPMEPAPIDDAVASASSVSGFLFFFGFLILSCAVFVRFFYNRCFKKHPAAFSSLIRKISSQLRRKGRRPYQQHQIHLNFNVDKYNQLTKDDLCLILRAGFGRTPNRSEHNKVELMNLLLTAYSNALRNMEMQELFSYVEGKDLHPTKQMNKEQLVRLAVEAGF